MKFISWKKGVFYLTLVVSISFGVLMATKNRFLSTFLSANVRQATRYCLWVQSQKFR